MGARFVTFDNSFPKPAEVLVVTVDKLMQTKTDVRGKHLNDEFRKIFSLILKVIPLGMGVGVAVYLF